MSQSDKPWERPWPPQEMIKNSSNWSLAGDAGLLKYLEDFSEKMLSRVKDTNDRLNDLIDTADETSLALHNATNKFMGLRNTQFIESRVYEDDETLPTKQTPEKEEKPKPTEPERLEEMKKAIYKGLEIIDKYYEKVEIPESDSDDDIDGPNILYRPIDPYIDRPLPYLIGSAEWHKYWHVGLGHSSSDSEVENDQDQFSETESEQEVQDLPERDRTQIPGISDSESEDLPKTKMSKPVANSTFNDNTNRNMFDSSSDSETGSLVPQVNTVNSNFAEELAAKLGKVESATQPEVNTKPIKKQPPSNIAGGLFSDEPPPLDDDDIFVKKNMNSGLFSTGDNLFDDVDDDNDFWKGPSTKTLLTNVNKPKDDLFGDGDKEIEQSRTEKLPEVKQAKKPSGLFDEDDDDLFSAPSLSQPKKTILAPFKTAAPLLNEEPPELEPTTKPTPQEEAKKKKPVGGVSVLGPNALLQQHILKTRPPSSSESSDSEPTNVIPPKTEPKDLPKKVDPVKNISKENIKSPAEISKVSSIFDDTSPLFSDDIFNTSSSKKFTSNLFDPEPESINDDVLFGVDNKKDEIKKGEKKKEETEKTNLFDNLENNKQDEEDKKKQNLFIDEPPPIQSSKNNFDSEDDLFSSKPKPLPKPDIPSNSKLFAKSESLFDDLGDELFNTSSISASNKSKVDLFDPNPPELDDFDNKSESQSQFSLENEPVSYGSMNAGRANLFDTEPPLLSNESSGIVRDQSRFEEDSSFYPYLTSSRRQSDLFHDQSDSLLTAKNKLSVGGDSNPNLGKIYEDTATKIDITPSGNESSLFQNSSTTESVNKTNLFDEEIDSLITAKNKLSIAGDSNQNLDKIPEDTATKIEVTPSGNESSLFNISSTTESVKKTNLFDEEIGEKSKLSISGDSNPNLDKIPEDTATKIEVTSSGNESSLFNISSTTESIKKTNIFDEEIGNLSTGKNKLSISGDSNPNSDKIPEDSATKIEVTPSENESSLFNISSTVNKTNLFEEESLFKPEIKIKPASLFDEAKSNLFVTNKTEKEENKNIPKKKKNILLFGESDSDEDLFSNKSSGSKNSASSDNLNNSSNISSKPAKTLKNKNIFEDDLFSGSNTDEIPDVDIFNKNKNLQSSSSDEFNNTKSVFGQNDDKKEDMEENKNNINDNKKFNYEENLKSDENVKTDPKKSLSFEKNVELEKQIAKEEIDGQILSAGSSPGKLRHSLNINVAALLPGASPPRRQNLEKSTSLDSSDSNQNAPIEEKTKSTEKIPEAKPKPIEKSISFDEPVKSGEILISANKERVKIPVKRRPSTRRGRQEALRKSAIDLNYEDAVTENDKNAKKSETPPDKTETQNILNIANNNVTKPSKDEENKIKNPLLNPLSPSTDEEDLLTMPKEKDFSSENFKDSLFGEAPVLSPVDLSTSEDKRNLPNKTSDNLFDKTKDDQNKQNMQTNAKTTDNLFGVITKDNQNKRNIAANEPSLTVEADNLFDKKDNQNKKSIQKTEPVKTTETDLFGAATNDDENKRFLQTVEPPKTIEKTSETNKTTEVKKSADASKIIEARKTSETNKTTEVKKPADASKTIEVRKTVSSKTTESSKTVGSKTIESSKTKDLFGETTDIFSSIKKEIKASKTDSSIFSSSDSENDLFSTPKSELKKPDNNNFASPDEDLFKSVVSTSSVSVPTQRNILSREDSLFEDEDIFSSKKIPPKSTIIKKSLFDDDDDNDDDIFGGSSSIAPRPNTQTQSLKIKKTPAPSRLKKLSSDAMQDIDDPLEALKK